MKRLIVVLLLTCLAAAAWGCGGNPDPTPTPAGDQGAAQVSPASGGETTPQGSSDTDSEGSRPSSSDDTDSSDDSNGDSGEHHSGDDDDSGKNVEQKSDDKDDDSGYSGQSSSSSDDDDSDSDSDGDSNGHDSDGDSDDDTVSRENPGFMGTRFDSSQNDALFDAQPLDAVTWTAEPVISAGALEAAGVLDAGIMLFNPMIDGEGAGFIVYYKGASEPLVLLLPDLGPIHIWETDLTVAPMEHEVEGASFSIRAYSPLFMDTGPGDLELRVFGYDANGDDSLLAIQPIAAP